MFKIHNEKVFTLFYKLPGNPVGELHNFVSDIAVLVLKKKQTGVQKIDETELQDQRHLGEVVLVEGRQIGGYCPGRRQPLRVIDVFEATSTM